MYIVSVYWVYTYLFVQTMCVLGVYTYVYRVSVYWVYKHVYAVYLCTACTVYTYLCVHCIGVLGVCTYLKYIWYDSSLSHISE